MSKISLNRMADFISEHWKPLDIFRVNQCAIKLVKIKGRYHWHKHSNQDELFIVRKGQLKINLKDRQIILDEDEGFLVKRGVLHQSEADEETVVLLVEPYDIITEGD